MPVSEAVTLALFYDNLTARERSERHQHHRSSCHAVEYGIDPACLEPGFSLPIASRLRGLGNFRDSLEPRGF